MSTWLAEAAKGDAPPTELEDVVPEPYLDFWDVFSKESFDELLERKQWDHAIDLIPGSKPFNTKVYPISPVKQKELDGFLDENLSISRICPSKLLMASLVFFFFIFFYFFYHFINLWAEPMMVVTYIVISPSYGQLCEVLGFGVRDPVDDIRDEGSG